MPIKINKLNLGMFFLVALCSCEKVIDINLNGAQPLYVIEGNITNHPSSCKVLISQSVNFDDNNNVPSISGAQVSITDNAGITTNLIETSSGVYESGSLIAIPGKTYDLKVVINGEIFTSSSTVPVIVSLDSLYIVEKSTPHGGAIKIATVRYRDPPGKGNNYRFIQYANGKKEKIIFLGNDDLSDGRILNTELLVRDADHELVRGDNVKVEMQCIDAGVYKYWYSLNKGATGGIEIATPANPVSNFQGGALGYFNACTVMAKTVIVQ
jgi:Domain of unknown function (DUF4249)